MLGETHEKIAKELGKQLGLGQRETKILITGSLSPDGWANFPHHSGKESEIVELILTARKQFLADDDECYSTLGMTLHYIQDRWTLSPRLKDKHTEYEVNISYGEIVSDSDIASSIRNAAFPSKAQLAYTDLLKVIPLSGVQTVPEEELLKSWGNRPLPLAIRVYFVHDSDGRLISSFMNKQCLRTLLFALLDRPTTWSTTQIDLNFSYRICLIVAQNVLNKEDQNEWINSKAREEYLRASQNTLKKSGANDAWIKTLLILVPILLFGGVLGAIFDHNPARGTVYIIMIVGGLLTPLLILPLLYIKYPHAR